ncbi:MAG TPA: hypothetical protein VHZ95_22055 [Polyangiales bacterium]|nr:hypothetical protein [Polyangiales bacterium]
MTPAPRGKIIVSGILFWYPLAGVTYQFLHYMLGLRRLGWDVYYIEDSGRWLYDPFNRIITGDAEPNVARVAPVLAAHGFEGKWAFRGAYPNGACYGMNEGQILQLYREADALLNVTGAQEIRDEHRVIPRRIFVESDPFGSQVKLFNGDPKMRALLDDHDTWFTFGENVGQSDCSVPIDRTWLPTRQPIALELWEQNTNIDTDTYNTITTWHNDGKTVEYLGETYHWTKDREFVHYLELPQLKSGVRFELATDADPAARALLEQHHWQIIDALTISGSVADYHAYISRARGEFTVARDQYVRPHTGWFSDRSASYLAASRPVITQETGFSKFLPTGRGLFGFRTREDILRAVDAIESDYPLHQRAAREIAREYFAADRVLASLLERAGL